MMSAADPTKSNQMDAPTEMRYLTSGNVSFLHKFILPAAFLFTLPFWINGALKHREPPFPAIFWSCACGFFVWHALRIKQVSTKGDKFVIGNFFSTIEVPISHLSRVSGCRWNRTPTITLHFDPPTQMVAAVTMIPGGDFGRKKYDEVFHECTELARQAAAARNSTPKQVR
jgi:hypothetical protein